MLLKGKICGRFKGIHLPACPVESRWKIVHNLIVQYRETGAGWAADALELKPCDMWQQLRGRTTYVIGDSLSQVTKRSFLATPGSLFACNALGQTRRCTTR